MTKQKVKLVGEVYHVDKEKFEQIIRTLVALPYQQVATVLDGIVALTSDSLNQKGSGSALEEESEVLEETGDAERKAS